MGIEGSITLFGQRPESVRIVVAGDDFFTDKLHRREKNTPAATVDGSIPIRDGPKR
jgi:hypothetical protein